MKKFLKEFKFFITNLNMSVDDPNFYEWLEIQTKYARAIAVFALVFVILKLCL